MDNKNSNRRSSVRHARPGGFARCVTQGAEQRYRINDASRTGVAIAGGPRINPGTNVGVSLWWPRIGRATARGVVCRQEETVGRLALCYTDESGMSDLLRKLQTIEQLRNERPIPLLCGKGALISRVGEQLDEAGIAYAHTKSPLGALQHLQDPWEPVTSLVFESDPNWLALSALVGSEHPDVERVLLGQDKFRALPREAGAATLFDRGLDSTWPSSSLFDALSVSFEAGRCVCCNRLLSSVASPFCACCTERSSNLSLLDDLGGSD